MPKSRIKQAYTASDEYVVCQNHLFEFFILIHSKFENFKTHFIEEKKTHFIEKNSVYQKKKNKFFEKFTDQVFRQTQARPEL